MNIFVLDTDPERAAEYQCDKHVVKMILESVQILCSRYPEPYVTPVARTQRNHPAVRWAWANRTNYLWLLRHTKALLSQYRYRYKRVHALTSALTWAEHNHGYVLPSHIGDAYIPFCYVGPKGHYVFCRGDAADTVAAYRRYYIMEKRRFARYTACKPPEWFREALNGPPTLAVKQKGKASLLLGIPGKITHSHVSLSLYDAYQDGMPAVGDRPLKVWYDGTTDSPQHTLAPAMGRVLKELRGFA